MAGRPKAPTNIPGLPPAGVSAIGENEQRRPIPASERQDVLPDEQRAPRRAAAQAAPTDEGDEQPLPVRARPAPRRQRPGEDVLANPQRGRQIKSQVPNGVSGQGQDIIEMPGPKMQKPFRHTTSFRSIDGNDYSFRTHDTKGKSLPYRNEMTLFIALVEMAKGGSPLGVFKAFKLKIDDMDGGPYYPIPEDILATLSIPVVEDEPAEEEGPSGFSLGE